jgi:hypothetical protein
MIKDTAQLMLQSSKETGLDETKYMGMSKPK